jgi:hypothetical protein
MYRYSLPTHVTVYGSNAAKESRMAVERTSTGSSLVEVLDRVLDKGIVIDAWVRLSLVGIDLVTVEARVVVASIATYLQFTETVGASTLLASAPSAARLSPSFPRTLRRGKESLDGSRIA